MFVSILCTIRTSFWLIVIAVKVSWRKLIVYVGYKTLRVRDFCQPYFWHFITHVTSLTRSFIQRRHIFGLFVIIDDHNFVFIENSRVKQLISFLMHSSRRYELRLFSFIWWCLLIKASTIIVWVQRVIAYIFSFIKISSMWSSFITNTEDLDLSMFGTACWNFILKLD